MACDPPLGYAPPSCGKPRNTDAIRKNVPVSGRAPYKEDKVKGQRKEKDREKCYCVRCKVKKKKIDM